MFFRMKMAASWLGLKAKQLLSDERGEVNIVAMVVLIGIAVLLAIVFRGAIEGLIKSMLNNINSKANEAVS